MKSSISLQGSPCRKPLGPNHPTQRRINTALNISGNNLVPESDVSLVKISSPYRRFGSLTMVESANAPLSSSGLPLVLGPSNVAPVAFGAVAVAALAASARNMLKISPAEVEALLMEADRELAHASKITTVAEALVQVHADQALLEVQALERYLVPAGLVSHSSSSSQLRHSQSNQHSEERRLERKQHVILQQEASASSTEMSLTADISSPQMSLVAAAGISGTPVPGGGTTAVLDRPDLPDQKSFNLSSSSSSSSSFRETEAVPPSFVAEVVDEDVEERQDRVGPKQDDRVQNIMGRVSDILAVLEQQEQQHAIKEQVAAAAAASGGLTMSAVHAEIASRELQDRASPPGTPLSPSISSSSPNTLPEAAEVSYKVESTLHSQEEQLSQLSPPSPWDVSPVGLVTQQVNKDPDHTWHLEEQGQSSNHTWHLEEQAAAFQARQQIEQQRRMADVWGRPPDQQQQDYSEGSSRLSLPDLRTNMTPLNQLKCSLLDLVYGTARGVTATLNQRAQVEELITLMESMNPNSIVTDAVSVLHGRWKLVYTSSTQTLMLLRAIQQMPMVDIGDVYQVVDADTLTTHNKIDLALPVLMSLRADCGLEVRSPSTFKVRFHRVGLDTYLETPQLTSSLDMPQSISVLGHEINLDPIRQLLVNPVQSGLDSAQRVLRMATSPQFELPAVEANALWMLTTYLDGTLRISRDDAGATYVMLKDM